jgi:hypothetical protein
MRKILVLMAILAIALPAVAGDHPATKSTWFDMENCAFCENLIKDPALLEHTTWEGHALKNGIMYITTVDPEYAESMAKAAKAMEQVGSDLMSGKRNPMETKMCGHCAEFGQIMMAGVHMENVKGDAAEVSIFTSDDPALVKRMHTLVERDQQEMKLMMAADGGDKGHDEHPQ